MSLLGFYRVLFSRWDIAGKHSHFLGFITALDNFKAVFCFGLTGVPAFVRDQLAMRISRFQSG